MSHEAVAVVLFGVSGALELAGIATVAKETIAGRRRADEWLKDHATGDPDSISYKQWLTLLPLLRPVIRGNVSTVVLLSAGIAAGVAANMVSVL